MLLMKRFDMRRRTLLVIFLLGLSGASALNIKSPAAQKWPASVLPNLSQYKSVTLRNEFLTVRLYLPDADNGYYRGTRFDWSGLISRVEFQGHTFFCEFRKQHDPLNHDDICGSSEEFGMTVPPPGYEDARPGDPFVKIGVGVLERGDDASFQFWKRYKILKAGEWKVTPSKDAIEFTQELQGPSGWAYTYIKTLRLSPDAPVLTISRRLTNTGTKTIETDHYGHNFMKIDDAPAGPDYTLEFPFIPRFGEKAETQESVELKGKSLVFVKEIRDKAVWTPIEGYSKPEDNRLTVVNNRSGASMAITTDQPLARLVFYSSDGVLAPEPFVKLSIPPGQTQHWATTYRFATRVP
jgi:hypothetical protein